MGVGARGAEPVAGKGDRLGEQVGPRQPAICSMHLAERRHGARHRNRHRAGARDPAGVALRRRQGGGGARAVEHDGAAGRLVPYMVEPVAAEPRHHRLDDGERHRRRDRRIHRIAARPQRQEAGLDGERVVGRDGAAPPDDHRPVGTHFCSHYHSPFGTMVSDKASGALSGGGIITSSEGFRACPPGTRNNGAGEGMKKRYWFSVMALMLSLVAAGCADPGAASDNDKRGVFYGGVSAGGTRP